MGVEMDAMNLKKGPQAQAEAMVAALLRHCPALQVTVCRAPGTDRQAVLRPYHDLHSVGDMRKLLPWLRAENSLREGQVWVRPDPRQPHGWLLLDDLPVARALSVVRKYAGLVIETSLGNAQVRLRAVRALNTAERTTVQRALAKMIGGDDGSIAGDKWGRLSGFTNRKPDKAGQWTNLLADTTATTAPRLDPSPYLVRADLHPHGAVPSIEGGACSRSLVKKVGSASESHKAFGSMIGRLRWAKATRPEDYETIRAALIEDQTQRALARGKRRTYSQARAWAELTVRKAEAVMASGEQWNREVS